MKELLVIRHAKSSWDFPGLADYERPLNERGKKTAPRVARELVDMGLNPSAFIASPAVRAWETAKVIAGAFGREEGDIVRVEDIYGAGSSGLISIVQQFDEAWPSAAIFGHNPGFHDLVDRLAGSANVAHFPTCAVAQLRLEVDHWGEADDGCASLQRLIIPRELDPE